MMRLNTLFALALTFLILGTTETRADPIKWGFDWSASSVFTPGSQNLTASMGGYVKMSNEDPRNVAGSSQIVATNLTTFSTQDPLLPAFTPDVFDGGTPSIDGKFKLTLNLKDTATGQTGTIEFFGQLIGDFSFRHSLVDLADGLLGTTVTKTIGNTVFTVEMNKFTPPGPTEQGNGGAIGARVTVAPASPNPNQTPEPSALLLAGIALSALGARSVRRRRRMKARAEAAVA